MLKQKELVLVLRVLWVVFVISAVVALIGFVISADSLSAVSLNGFFWVGYVWIGAGVLLALECLVAMASDRFRH